MFLLVLWVLEGSYSVIKASDIAAPRRELHEYECGERVQAKFDKKIYPAKIVRKGDNQKDLNVVMNQIISRCNQKMMSVLDIEEEDTEGQAKKFSAHSSMANTENPKKVMERSALQEKNLKAKELREEKLQRAEALRRSKENVLATLEERLKTRSTIPSFSPSSSSSCPSPTTSLSSLSPVRRSPRTKRSLFSNQVNRKGHPTVAEKQPRAHFSPGTPSCTPNSSPGKSLVSSPATSQNLAVMTPVSPSLFPNRKRSISPCKRCEMLENENRGLKRQIEEIRKNIDLSKSVASADLYSRPKAGVYGQEFALANGMLELVQGMGVYLHKDQFQTALNKAAPCVSPRANSKTQDAKRDGKRVGRYLLTAFFSQEELAKSSLTNSDLSQYPALNRQIVDAITAFSVCNSDTPRGEILRAMRASLTSKRCKGKKTEKTCA